jgi:SulP family sulfate permease
MIEKLRQTLHPRRLLPSLAAGLVTGVIAVTIATAFATLVFAGDLSGHIPRGIGLMLCGTIVIGSLTALLSSLPGLVAGLQDSAVAILALVAASIAQTMPASATPQETFTTIVVAIALASFLTGGTFLLLGQFKLGNLIRFIPYPVVGGLLGGTGLLLALGALSVLADAPVSLTHLSPLAQPDLVVKWLPSLLLAVLLLVLARRSSHALLVPGVLVASVSAFYVLLWLTGTPVAEATAHGWLLDSLSTGGGRLWQPLIPSDLTAINWPILAGQIPGLLATAAVSVISMLLCTTGIELSTKQDIDLNHELKAAGVANIVAGLSGNMGGFHVLGDTTLVHKMGGKSRLVGVFMAVVCGGVLLTGESLVSLLPIPVLSGLLLFLGLDFMVTWVYDAWFQLSVADYAIVLLILIVIGCIGFLQGIGLGMALAVVLFVVDYSRVNVVRHTLSGVSYQSNVDRPRLYRQLLRQKGHWIYALELQGFIFFGTANTLLEQVHQQLNDPCPGPPHFVVLDFRLVTGIDASAAFSFAKMQQMVDARNVTLVLTHLSPKMQRQMEKAVFQDGDQAAWHVFPDLDHGIEWCERQMIKTFESVGFGAKPKTLMKLLESGLPSPNDVVKLMHYFERQDVIQGDCIIRQGDTYSGLYFIEAGQVTVTFDCGDGRIVRLRMIGRGSVVGEIGLYLKRQASASVVTDQPSTLYFLSADKLCEMERDAPEIATAFHRFIANILAERLVNSNDTIQALLE